MILLIFGFILSYSIQEDVQRITQKLLTNRLLLPFVLLLQMAPVFRYVILRLYNNTKTDLLFYKNLLNSYI